MPTPSKVKFKYGTFEQYNALQGKDSSTLYFITDRGIVYKGTDEVTKHIVITDHTGAGYGNGEKHIVITDNSTNSGGTASSFSIYNTTAVNTLLSTHAALVGSGSVQGHVYLSDAIDSTLAAASGGTAATPKAVKDALAAANTYTDTQIGNLAGAMVFKGVIGTADPYDSTSTYNIGDYCVLSGKLLRCIQRIGTPKEFDSTDWEIITDITSLPTNGYKAGWTYRCVTAGTFAGKNCEVGDMIVAVNNGPSTGSTVVNDDWTVLQSNIDGAVFTSDTLTANDVIVGNGTTQVKKLATGSNGQYLKVSSGAPAWANLLNEENGFFYGESSTQPDASTPNGQTKPNKYYKVVYPSGFSVKEFGLFAVTFSYENVGVGSSKNYVRITSALSNGTVLADLEMVRGNQSIGGDVIKQGETALFMIVESGTPNLSGTVFNAMLIATDKENPTSVSQLSLDAFGLAVCTGSTTALDATLSGFVLKNNAIVSVGFSNAVLASSTLNINGTGAKAIYHRNAAITANTILAGDTATFVYNGTTYNLLAIDRPVDTTATQNSTNLITSGAVYDNTCWWETIAI